MRKTDKGYSLIEALLLIVLVSIFILFVAKFFSEHTRALALADNLTQAMNLARLEMTKVDNLSFTDPTLADGYNTTTSNYEGYRLDLNRSVDIVAGTNNNLKKVEVKVYESGTTTQLAKLAGYAANVSFGPGSGGGAPAQGEADSLTVSGGSIFRRNLQNITLGNTSSNPITITGVTITFSGTSGIKLNLIIMNWVIRWIGFAVSGSTITLISSFQLNANTTYSNTCHFRFSSYLSSATVIFEMSDGSVTPSHSW